MTRYLLLPIILLTACGITNGSRANGIVESDSFSVLEAQLLSCVRVGCKKVMFAEPVGSAELKPCAVNAITKAVVRNRSMQFYSPLGRQVPTITYEANGETCKDILVMVYFDGDAKGFNKAIVDVAFF